MAHRGQQAIAVLWVTLGASGCFLPGVRERVETYEVGSTIAGEVVAPTGWSRTTVVLIRESGSSPPRVEATWPAARPGRFAFMVRPGSFRIAAFRDDAGGIPPADLGQWAFPRPADTLHVESGQALTGVVLAPGGDWAAVHARGFRAATTLAALRSAPAQRQVGVVVSLSDSRFGSEAGKSAYWRPWVFAERYGWGLFLLQPWDPAKIPVLFVHGARGYPQEWERLAAGLDRTRYQPVMFQYPSGMRLQPVVDGLVDMLEELHETFAFRELVIVAHSMGGLVARKAISRGTTGTWTDTVRLLVTISTPWAGIDGADRARKESAFAVPSWVDVASGSEFVRSVHATPLPPGVRSALFFGYDRGHTILPGESSDRTVPLRSQLDPEAQAEASVLRGFDEDHESILTSDAVAAELSRLILAR
jgi:alpha-beta hydrolase superfamily lysophospholipase